MTPTASNIRGFLLVRPRPLAVKLIAASGSQDLEIGKDPNWARLADTIEAIDPDVVEVYDKSGKLIRAAARDSFESGDDDDPEAPRQGRKVVPVTDPETARYKIFADHLAAAYQFATGVAFERMVDLFAAVNKRSESLEKSLDATHRLLGKAYQEQVDAALDNAENVDPATKLVSAFLNGATQAAAEKTAAKAPPNGKAAKA
jgi:hypothetical protein